jgi:hypothetical protein
VRFLFPAFLAGALAIAIPIALHFLRRDVAPEVPFSAVRLLQRSPIQRSRRRRLRDLLLLAARVAALLLLAAAFARPYGARASGAAGAICIVALDRSFSMTAPGRFEQARALASRAIDEAAAGERVALLAFDDTAEVRSAPGAPGDARTALAAIEPGYGATRYGALLSKAADVAAGAPARLVIVTDMQRAGWEGDRQARLPASIQLEFRDLGAPPPNAAVDDVRVEGARVVATVSHSGAAREGRVRVLHDGREVAAAGYAAGADSIASVSIPYRAPASGALSVAVDDAAGAPADNVRYVGLDASAPSPVLVVTAPAAPRSAFYLTRALEVADDDDSGGPIRLRVVPGPRVSSQGTDLRASAAVVLLSTRGLDRPARERLAAFVRGGGGLLIAAADDVEPDVLSTTFGWEPALDATRASEPATLAATDPRHPIFRPFGAMAANLGQVRFERTWTVDPRGWDVAARFSDGSPALLERLEGSGRVVLFASDLDRRWNDFPLHPSFVPFAIETIRYVAGPAPPGTSFVVGSAPAGVPRQPGVHTAPGAARPVVVNVDARESATSRITADEFSMMVDRISLPGPAAAAIVPEQVEARQSWWQVGLLLMLAVLVVESFVGRA